MYKKKRVILLLLIIFIVSSLMVYIYTQHYNYVKNSKLRSEITTEDKHILKDLVDSEINDTDKCIEELTLKLKNETNDMRIGIYNEAIGRAYVKGYDKENWNKYLNNALKIYETTKYGEKRGFKLNLLLTHLYMSEGDYIKSADYCYKILDMINNSETEDISDDDITEAKLLISAMSLEAFLEANFKEQAKIYYDKINQINKEGNLYKEYKDILLYDKYLYEIEVGDNLKAKSSIDELYDLACKNQLKSQFISKESIKLSLIRTKIKLGDEVGLINEIDDVTEISKANKNLLYLGMCHLTYGNYYDLIEEYEKSKENYDKAKEYFEKLNYGRGIIRCCKNIIKIHENKKKFEDVSEYYLKYFKYSHDIEENDSLKLLIKALGYANKELSVTKTKSLNKEKIAIENKNNDMKKVSWILVIIIISMIIVLYKLYSQVCKRIKREEYLKESLNVDYLTQSYTKAYGYEKIEKLIKEKENFYLAIIDLDDFKGINDTYGHIFGDMVLSDIAINIKKSLDVGDFLIRFGGEEFIIVIVNKTYSEVRGKLEEIRVKIEGMKWGRNLKTTISIGVAKYIDNDLKSFLEKVDELLYIAKNSGKNKIEMEKVPS